MRNIFESKFIADYRVLEIVNDCTLIGQSPNGKTGHININNAKPISARAATTMSARFKLAAMKKEHTHHYQLRSLAK